MFRMRIFSAIVGIPILLGILYLGGVYAQAFFLLIGIFSLYEFYRMMNANNYQTLYWLGYFLLIILIISSIIAKHHLPIFYGIIFVCVLYSIAVYPKYKITDIALSLVVPVYLGFMLSFAVRIAELPHSFSIYVLAFLLTWGNDTGGYMFGMLWGKHKLAPLLSPKKTWEGSAGGLLVAAIVAAVFFKYFFWADYSWLNVLGIIILSSLAAQAGDLFISLIKRYFGFKDSGNIIPGHGGVLDRFDSFFLLVPVVYIYFIWFLNIVT